MNFGSSLPVDELPTEAAWQEIEAVLEGLANLVRSDVAPAELHGRVLERLVGLLSAAGGVVWSQAPDRRPSAECQLHHDQSLAGDTQEQAEGKFDKMNLQTLRRMVDSPQRTQSTRRKATTTKAKNKI